ncbi:MAG TPA: helix-turn-helix domain-containing protein [Clostridia bacterium]|nr:helix-turn-helix domain-containing protein [Clostridia bacterium]
MKEKISEKDFKATVAGNLVFYRNLADMTQLQVAEALNYSDKSVSKWERGEGLPDMYVLYQIASLYHVGINDLLNTSRKKRMPFERRGKLLVSLLSTGIVWLVAVIVFVALTLFTEVPDAWMTFVYAIPVSSIVLVVFSAIWAKRVLTGIVSSIIIWSLSAAIYLTFSIAVDKIGVIFLISGTLQILAIMWFFLRDLLYKMRKAAPIYQTSDENNKNKIDGE